MGDLLRDTRIHAVLGAIVVTIGVWLAVGAAPAELLGAVALGVAGFLVWQGTTIGRIWGWTSLLVGLASAAWPIATMVQVRGQTAEPSDEQMGLILTAVVAGLFASVFWTSFAVGIFRWIKRRETEQAEAKVKAEAADRQRSKKQSQGRR